MSKIWRELSLISTHRSSVRSSLSTHAWTIAAADASPNGPLTSFGSIIVRFGQTSSKNSGMTAGEALADGGNGSPAMGPGTERGQDHANAHMGGSRPESSAVKGTRAGIGLPLKVEKSLDVLSQV